MAVIEFKNVSKSFGTGEHTTHVLKNINLNVEEGEFLVLLGFSGTGKTTLINLMAGIEKPTTGGVTYRVKEITGGEGVAVSYDGVGQATYKASLDSLRPFGHMVSFGNASGSVTGIEMADLAAKSLTLSRPSLFHYTDSAPMIKISCECNSLSLSA